jgi:hypothetical protein
MKTERVHRLIPVALAALLLPLAAGCSSTESVARHQKEAVHLGMAKEEVRQALGEPFAIVQSPGPPPLERWTYVYGMTGRAWEVFEDVAYALGVVATFAAVSLEGKPNALAEAPAQPATASTPRVWRLSIRFDPSGNVEEISELW